MAKESDGTTFDIKNISESRLNRPDLQESILGGLSYLNDTHVYNPEKFKTTPADFTTFRKKSEYVFSRLRTFIGRYLIREKHLPGTWPGFIHYMPNFSKSPLKPLFVVADYNLFTTVSTAFPLLLFDDRTLPENLRPVSIMLKNAHQTLECFKRGDAYNFWRTGKDKRAGYPCSAPLNIPVWLVGLRWNIHKYTGLLGLKKFHESDVLFDWIQECYENKTNLAGGAAIFNIPDDADNTSMAVGFQILYSKKTGAEINPGDISPIDNVGVFRDLNRSKSDRMNPPEYKNSGAYLTWFHDEEMPLFSNPGKGVIPLGVNNIDCTINANVLFALSLSGKMNMPGCKETLVFISKIITARQWADISLYYPQKLVFPYTISRAWRDGNLNDPQLTYSLGILMKQVLDEQQQFEKNSPELKGAFPDGKHNDLVFSTALGLATLLNLGRRMAEENNLAATFDEVVENSVQFIIKNSRRSYIRQKKTKELFAEITPLFWESGVLYSSSLKQLAHWRSHSQSTALVLEVLAKYILGYDLDGSSFLSRQISLTYQNNRLSLTLPEN